MAITRFTVDTKVIDTRMNQMVNEIDSAIGQIAYLTAPNRNVVSVEKTGGQFSTINGAITFAKTYCTPTNRVVIKVGAGDFLEEITLFPNPGIDIVGAGASITRVVFPSIYPNSPIYTMGAGYFSNISFVSTIGGTGSYAFHFESQTNPATGTIVFENCIFSSVNNAGVGLGMGQDTKIQFNSCEIYSIGYSAVYFHNFPGNNISNQFLEFNHCNINTYGYDKCLTIDDAAKIYGYSNSVLQFNLSNCQSNNPIISYKIGSSSFMSYIPKTNTDIRLLPNSSNNNILGCDYDFAYFATGGVIAVAGSGLMTFNLSNAKKYNYEVISAVDENGTDVLGTLSYGGVSDGYVIFITNSVTLKGKTVNINVVATVK